MTDAMTVQGQQSSSNPWLWTLGGAGLGLAGGATAGHYGYGINTQYASNWEDAVKKTNEDDKFVNLAVGDMMDGFDGMVMADLYNSDNSAKTIFLVVYDDGTSELIETENGSSHYYCYMRMVK